MKKAKKPIRFKNEDEEFDFWARADSTQYINKDSVCKGRFPNLKTTSMPIYIRVPVSLLERVKIKAHSYDMPYQSLIKLLIAEGLKLSSDFKKLNANFSRS